MLTSSGAVRGAVSTLLLVGLGALAAAPADGPFKGDLPALQKRGALRILVPARTEQLGRRASPMAAERALAERFAKKLGLTPVFVELTSPQPFPSSRRARAIWWWPRSPSPRIARPRRSSPGPCASCGSSWW